MVSLNTLNIYRYPYNFQQLTSLKPQANLKVCVCVRVVGVIATCYGHKIATYPEVFHLY